MKQGFPCCALPPRRPISRVTQPFGGKLESLKAEIPELTLEDMKDIIDTTKIGLKGSPTKVKSTFTPKRTATGVRIEGGPQKMAASLLDCLKESKVL